MRRFVLPASWNGGPDCRLDARDSRRLVQVLRLRAGDSFPAMSADGSLYTCRILKDELASVLLTVTPVVPQDACAGEASAAGDFLADVRAGRAGESSQPPHSAMPEGGSQTPELAELPDFTLALGLLKGSKLDDVVRMAAEAGVRRIVPLSCARSVPRHEDGARLERLQRIVREALGQSGSAVPTTVEPICSLPAFLNTYGTASEASAAVLRLYFHEQPLAPYSLHQYCTDSAGAVVACVGPEGGFSPEELLFFDHAGFSAAWLGPAVLRAESAAIFALASLRLLFLERNTWINNE